MSKSKTMSPLLVLIVAVGLSVAGCGGTGTSSGLQADAAPSGGAQGSEVQPGGSEEQGSGSAETDTGGRPSGDGSIAEPVPEGPIGDLPDVSQPVITTGSTITDISIWGAQQAGTATDDVPVTFGQVFAPGHIPGGEAVAVVDSSGVSLPSQMDVKARHPDGSVRHAILTTRAPTVHGQASTDLDLVRVASGTTTGSGPSLADLAASGFDATVEISEGGQLWSASAAALLAAASNPQVWLSGPLVREWVVSGPLVNASGSEHALLHVRFNVRAYAGLDRVRVSVTVENTWSYADNPRNVTYDLSVKVDGNSVLEAPGVTHYHHARWRRVFWSGSAPSVHVAHDRDYLIASGVVPNYDRSLDIGEPSLEALGSAWTADAAGLMRTGALIPDHMSTAGAQAGIGPLPRWGALYLLTMDSRAKRVTLGNAEQAGTWSNHYRYQPTDRPLTVRDKPYATLLGGRGDSRNPSTGEYEAFPDCVDCRTPYDPDSAHQPSLAYLPYLVTGDHYYLEELQFWTNYNMIQANPNYREGDRGLQYWDQPRGVAWTMRTLAQAAYILPDGDPMKNLFAEVLENNRVYFVENYVNGTHPDANPLGWMGRTQDQGTNYKSWMDDFITWAAGHIVELGFEQWRELAEWKARFPVGRMTAPGYCWIVGAPYIFPVRPDPGAPVFESFAAAYDELTREFYPGIVGDACNSQAMADALGVEVGEMVGHAQSATGYPSNLQPALAVAADLGVANSANAWSVFSARSVKPDNYNMSPQFAVVPRGTGWSPGDVTVSDESTDSGAIGTNGDTTGEVVATDSGVSGP